LVPLPGFVFSIFAVAGLAAALEAQTLELGHPVELNLAAGETQTVRIPASAGDYLEITATPDSELAIKTSLMNPSGQLVAVTPSLGGTGGRARIAAYAESDGEFRLQVTSLMFRSDARVCSIALASRQPATDRNRLDAEAHREFAKAAAQAVTGPPGMRAAIANLDRPIDLAHRSGDDLLELRAVFGKGQFHAMLGELQAALPFFDAALDLSRKAGDARAEAHTLDDTALVYANLERYNDAIERYNQALELQAKVGQPWETALTLGNLADAETALGRIDIALEDLRRQEQIRMDLNDEFGLAETRMGMADIDLITGEQERAIEELINTLPHWPKFRDKEDGKESEIAAYRKLGVAYTALGNYDSAAVNLQKAMKLAQALGNKRIIAETWVVEAELAPLRGDPARALEIAEQALAASRAAEYQRGEALALIQIAKRLIAEGRARPAVAASEQALEIATKLGQPYDEANARLALGIAKAALHETGAARQEYATALTIERRLGDRFGEVQTLVESAKLEDKIGQPTQALARLEEALVVIDETRSSLAAPELRASYLASQREAYELSARILVRLSAKHPEENYGLRAFDISERAHARTLLDALGENRGKTGRDADGEWTPRLKAVEASLHVLASADDSPHRDARIADLLAARNQLELQSNVQRAAAGSAAPLSLARIREQLLSGDSILLEYLVGTQQSHLWVVNRRAFRHYALPDGADLGAHVRRVYDAVTAGNHLPLTHSLAEREAKLAESDSLTSREAADLARILLPMSAAELGTSTILIVGDGPIQMVPFNLLLGNAHAIAMEPSASVLAQIREMPAPEASGRILVVADPVYRESDPRFKSLTPLPMSRVEAEMIGKLAPGRVTTLANVHATPASFQHLATDRFSVIHIAAHALLDDRHPDLSGLVFSAIDADGRHQDGLLPLFDIYKLRLQSGLVVLSACETYIGKDLRGEGFLGLARGFLYAGASQVLASLWKVDDRATAVFMEHFYDALLRDHLSAPSALQRAQNEMAHDPAWRSPRYWAGFVLEGDTR
jgi:CHAT domain-containing protein/tetratricopeptide (TPR) repeat protein